MVGRAADTTRGSTALREPAAATAMSERREISMARVYDGGTSALELPARGALGKVALAPGEADARAQRVRHVRAVTGVGTEAILGVVGFRVARQHRRVVDFADAALEDHRLVSRFEVDYGMRTSAQ